MQGIPDDISLVTKEWLTSALGSRYPGVTVGRAEHDRIVHGAATKIRLRLRYNDAGLAAGLPPVMWAKSGWEKHSAWLNSTSFIDAREARYYRDFAPLGVVNSPLCYFAAAEASGRGIVLLEDLQDRKVAFGDCTHAASVDQVAAMLKAYARLHARFWDDPNTEMTRGLDLPMRRDGASSEWPRANGPEAIARYLDSSRGLDVPAAVKFPVRIDAAFWKMLEDMSTFTPRCVLHGDAHPGNTFFDLDGTPGLYDWQTLSVGPWGHDVSYYICSALSIEDRRNSDRSLIRHYLAELRANGASAPSFEQAWLMQRRYIAYGLHIWITNRSDFQAEENCRAMATRLGTAAEDYEFFKAWDV